MQSKLSKPRFQDLAAIQLYMADRIQEAEALTDRTVNFRDRVLQVPEKIVWTKGKPQHHFGTKTGVSASVLMNDDMYQRLKRREAKRPPNCRYFFHHKGRPLRYDMVLKVYNQALKRAMLDQYSGTHIIRHTMGTLSRKIDGFDASQAILRHKSARMSEKYAQLDTDSKVSNVVIQAEQLFKDKVGSEFRATKCDQLVKDEIQERKT